MQPPEKQDHYRVLQVAQNATIAEIKAAYRKLVLLYHPDKEQQRTGNKHANTEKFRNIKDAHEALCNEYTRHTYDLNYAKISKEWDAYEAWQRQRHAAEEAERRKKAEEDSKYVPPHARPTPGSFASSSSSDATSEETTDWDELVARSTQALFDAEAKLKCQEMEHRRKTSAAQQVINDLESEQLKIDEEAKEDMAQMRREMEDYITKLQAMLESKLANRRAKASERTFEIGRRLWEAQVAAEDRADEERAAIERAKAGLRAAQANLIRVKANATRARDKAAHDKKRAEFEAKNRRAERERLAEERSREAAKKREAEEAEAAKERLRKEEERERLEEQRLREAAEKLKRAAEKAQEEAAEARAQKEKEERDRKAKEEWEQAVLNNQEAHHAVAIKRLTKLLANDKIRSGTKNPPDWPRSKGKGQCSYCGKLCPDFTFRCPDMNISACNVCRKHVCRFCTVCLVGPATHLNGKSAASHIKVAANDIQDALRPLRPPMLTKPP